MSEPATAERPATFREVMVSREFRAVFAASALSWFGDHAARAAVTALVLIETQSVALSAATFAISYLPWVGIGNILSALAERYSYRKVMILCDLLRMALMAVIAIASLPVPALMLLLFLTALLNPPFDSARSALLPRILDGDRYVVGLSIQKSAGQAARIFGYLGGAGLAAQDPRLALLFNAATFGVSALAVALGVQERAPALATDQRTNLLRETAEGFGVVYRNGVLRAIALVVFGSACFSVVPEGLAAAWAMDLTSTPSERGWYQGAIMMANAVGFVIGGIVVSRFVPPATRLRLIRPLGVLTPLVLVPALFDPDITMIVIMNVASGFALAGLMPASNGLFVQVLPDAFRARAFGVMQSGLHIIQGLAIFVTGWLADRIDLPLVVGGWSVLGVVVMVLIAFTWPDEATINDAVAAVRGRKSGATATVSGGAGGPAKTGARHAASDLSLDGPTLDLDTMAPVRRRPSPNGRPATAAAPTTGPANSPGPASPGPASPGPVSPGPVSPGAVGAGPQ